MTRHVDAMDAVGYWREVITNFYFDKPGDTVAGYILALVPMGRADPPTLKLQTKEGDVWVVPAHQARLRFELKKARPAKGDWVRITYNGEADKAAPGMSKTKDFTVEVKRPSPPAENEKGTRGSATISDPQGEKLLK